MLVTVGAERVYAWMHSHSALYFQLEFLLKYRKRCGFQLGSVAHKLKLTNLPLKSSYISCFGY